MADLLTLITVAAEVTDGYDRDDWKHWTDADRDGQDTRQEVLDAESLAATVVANRRIRQGLWRSLYDGQQITDAGQLDIDHVVALGEAHESGGWAWDASTRELYANDLTNPDHLIAVSRGTNRSKGKRDPAEWLPPDTASWCQYLALWTIVKVRWGLTMDQAEYNRILQEANSSCTTLRVDPARIER
ncbi:MAG: HNH endonuclease family protein [bacterium]|nr:HNH endonuclease family protein [bacterium]MCY4256895.1 HNH endonuclease family protein [bacterium]